MHIIFRLLVLHGLLFTSAVHATAITSKPWRADAAAYRVTTFYCALAPVPWDKIDLAWSAALPGAQSTRSAYDLLALWPTAAMLIPDIRRAIADSDEQALFETTTRAIARAMLSALDTAVLQTGSTERVSAEASNPVVNLAIAREYYRSFEDVIRGADPAAFRELGIAWLELTSSVGSRGLVGQGQVEQDQGKFNRARSVLVEYIKTNFDAAKFTERHQCDPTPESKIAQSLPASERSAPRATLPPGSFIGDQAPLPLLILNFEEQGIEESDLPMIAYGDMLFDSPMLFGEPARSLGISCATCHNRSDVNRDFFIPGLSHQPGSVDVDSAFFNAIANDHRDDPLDIPSLRGLRFTAPYGRDGRIASLRDFTRNVIVKEFAGAEPTPFMLDALLAYMEEFDFLPNSLVSPAGVLSDAVAENVRRGESLFKQPFAQMDGKSCATCHNPDGNFLDHKRHDIGTVKPAYSGARAGAMETPTLLGSVFTAPYFHDGSAPTLASVVDWFDQQFDLQLSQRNRSDLTAYLNVIGGADTPYEEFDATNTPFRLAFSELTTFASTLDTLLPRRDKVHALLLIDTVTTDMALDASVMQNLDAKLEIYQLAEALELVGTAIVDNDWQAAGKQWRVFNELLATVEKQAY